MRAGSLARGLVIGALAVFGLVFFSSFALAQTPAGTGAVQGQNGSTGGASVSGPVAGSNSAVLGAGPSAGTVGGSSQSQQLGDNTVAVNQSSEARSGDAVAGSQVTGVVGGDTTVQNQNSSLGAVALSGPAVASNRTVANAGPSAGSLGGRAQVGQVGDNAVIVNQRSEAVSGDAVAGAQVTGAVGGGITVQNSNSSLGALAVTGPACASFVCGGGNNLFVGAGPTAASIGILGPPAGAAQIGDNTVVISQSSVAKSGDALSGSQTTGAVGNDDMTVQNQNSSRGTAAATGPALATNLAVVNAGPTAAAAGLLLGTAQVSQTGNNRVVLAQESGATTGDALAGSQVTGLVSSEIANLTVQNQQSSDFDFALSGPAVATNVAPVAAGPTALTLGSVANTSQNGDNVVLVSQKSLARSGDALAGSGVTGVVGGSDVTVQNSNRAFAPVAISGLAVAANVAPVAAGPASFGFGGLLGVASASQFGSNEVGLDQDVVSSSGDALAGSQSTGVVGGGDVTVQNSNSAILPVALTGPSVAANVAPVHSGPVATSLSILGARAQVSQVGSNRANASQSVHSQTGDAVAGSQVTGAIGGPAGRTVVQNQNASLGSLAVSGPAFTGNLLYANVGPTAAALSLLLPSSASTSQLGDNDLLFAQDVVAHTGDGVAGSQVTGVVADLDPVIQGQNSTVGSLGLSGVVFGGNNAGGSVGATASALPGRANASTLQAGDSRIGGAQAIDMASGDGVSGSQVVGSVSGSGHTASQRPSFGSGFTADALGKGEFTVASEGTIGL